MVIAKALGVALLLALAGMGYQAKQAADARADHQQVTTAFATYREQIATSHAAALTQVRADESRARRVQQEALDAEFIARKAAEADAAAARTAAGQLRQRAQALATAARGSARDPATAGSSEAAGAAADLLADMLQRIDEAAGEIGRHADSARLAGQLCQRDYEALTP